MDTLFFKLLCTTPVTREGINITNLFHKHWQHQDFRKCRQATVLKRVLIFTRPRYTWGPIYGSGCRGLGRLGYRKKHPVVGWTVKFQVSGNFLVFTKKSPFWVINWNYVVGIGEPPLRDARFLHFPQKENIVKC